MFFMPVSKIYMCVLILTLKYRPGHRKKTFYITQALRMKIADFSEAVNLLNKLILIFLFASFLRFFLIRLFVINFTWNMSFFNTSQDETSRVKTCQAKTEVEKNQIWNAAIK